MSGVMDAPSGVVWTPGTGVVPVNSPELSTQGSLPSSLLGYASLLPLAPWMLAGQATNALLDIPKIWEDAPQAANDAVASLRGPVSEDDPSRAVAGQRAVDWSSNAALTMMGTPIAVAPERALAADEGTLASGGGWLTKPAQAPLVEKLSKLIEPGVMEDLQTIHDPNLVISHVYTAYPGEPEMVDTVLNHLSAQPTPWLQKVGNMPLKEKFSGYNIPDSTFHELNNLPTIGGVFDQLQKNITYAEAGLVNAGVPKSHIGILHDAAEAYNSGAEVNPAFAKTFQDDIMSSHAALKAWDNFTMAKDMWNDFNSYISTPHAPEDSIAFTVPAANDSVTNFAPAKPLELSHIPPNIFADAPAATWAGPGSFSAFHVTPHEWAPVIGRPMGEFNPTKVGQGEGNTDYGHGLYFAENPAVRDFYQQRLSDQYGAPANWMEMGVRPLPREFMDWDLLPNQQSPAVAEALAKVLNDPRLNMNDDFSGNAFDPTQQSAGELYNRLAAEFGSETDASKALELLGIPGIRYLDAGSCGVLPAGVHPTYNYVIFRPSDVKVLSHNGAPVPAALEPVEHNPMAPLDPTHLAVAQPSFYRMQFPDSSKARQNLAEFLRGYDRLRDPETGHPLVWFHGPGVDALSGVDQFRATKRGGVSLSANPNFAKTWTSRDTIYPTVVRAQRVADFRNPADVDRVAAYYLRQGNYSVRDMPRILRRLREGDWSLWEDDLHNGQMLKDLDYDAVHMVEDNGNLSSFNLFVRDPLNIKTLTQYPMRWNTESPQTTIPGSAGMVNTTFRHGDVTYRSGGAGTLSLIPVAHDPFEQGQNSPAGGIAPPP